MNISENAIGHGYGKTILFGEHFVVYGLPAIVSALSCKTVATIEKNSVNQVEDFRKKNLSFRPSLKVGYENILKNILKNILEFAQIHQPVKITLRGDLTVFSGGIGSSAAASVAIARAVDNFFNLNWSEQIINEAAFEGEKAVHGNPSGIDNTAAVFGGTFLFRKDFKQTKNFVHKIKLKNPIEIILADSGMPSDTKVVLEDVKNLKEQNEQKFNLIFHEYLNLLPKAQKALNEFDLKKVGELMNENHRLLQKINVSCEKLDKMIELVISAGAFGAKLTGTGRGGLMLALTPGNDLQELVAKKMEGAGCFVFKTTIG